MNNNIIRKASVAGSFYSERKKDLIKQIEDSFLHKYGPGKLPVFNQINNNLIGVIVPHAGIIYSGPIAAHSYNAIVEDGFADVFIIIGPNHQGFGSSSALFSKGYWETPLGKVKMDDYIIENLVEEEIKIDNESHPFGENSIEVQIPFLQYIGKGKKFSIVTISLAKQNFETVKSIGEKISKVIKKDDRKIIIIASSDFSHEGGAYGRLPPMNLNADEYARIQDKIAIEHINNLSPEGLIDAVYAKNISMCGYGAISTLIVAAKKLGATKAELLRYITSNDIQTSSFCVGYSSFIIK